MVIDPAEVRIDYICNEQLQAKNIRLGLLRLDEVHPLISGNKWFKLKENIRYALDRQYPAVLTFGGAWSNHLVATAAAAQHAGLTATGIVRGLHGEAAGSATLAQCAALGMQLHFVSRETYAQKEDPTYLNQLQARFSDHYIIPEGGNNESGMQGAKEIAAFLPDDATLVAAPIGTGTTFCGIRLALPVHINLLGFPVMKGGAYLQAGIVDRAGNTGNWQLYTGYHWGGFARHKPELIDFINAFYDRYAIPSTLCIPQR